MKIDSPLTLSSSCRTARQAARAAAALEVEISLGERSEDWYDLADEALEELHQRFPGFTRLDAYRLPPPLSPAARHALVKPGRLEFPRFRRHLNASGRKPGLGARHLDLSSDNAALRP
jgi:hypothetical protein